MTQIVPTKIIVRWRTRDAEAIDIIQKRFGFPKYITVNGWTPGVLKPEDKTDFDECIRRGFFSFKVADWVFNGKSYVWKME